ncbi:MAG: hypothetical protein DHS20C18_42060 [Saprospiraceae bacterium]|nr:MAG: hypothetical protein DHS20C18_42060 [Saprospiraceae bacterium]
MPNDNTVNLQHFNHLYKEINIDDDTMGIVHIYSEYPDYDYAIEPSEGFTCVDDVARAIVMLSAYYETGADTKEALRKLKMLVRFILYMQNDNGYFNNFLWNDFTINTTYKTSVAELNWWSLRALWALETSLPLISADEDLYDQIKAGIAKLIVNIKRDLGGQELIVETTNTLGLPTWLPQQYAADQAAVLVLGLLPYQARTGDPETKTLIDNMAKGLLLMQKGGETQYPYGVFLSWQNLWHAWGNSQAYALLKAGQQFNNEDYIKSALTEVDHFYPYLLKNGFAEAFWVEQEKDHFIETKRNPFPQIAYGIRPMVWAATEAYQITHQEKYLDLAKALKSWFSGNNVANTVMYDASTGRVYDGIISSQGVNKNSGAESTIECLLTLLKTN